jgi:predicted N-acetyltransferase YhbS
MQDQEVTIQTLQSEYFKDCLALWQAEGMAHEDDLARRLGVLLELNPGLSKVAVDCGRIVGCVLGSYNGISGYIFRLVVARDCRGRGIGRRLMAVCEEALHAAGAEKVIMNCDEGLAEYYRALGYKLTGARFFFKLLP